MPSIWVSRINRWIERSFNVKSGPAIVDINPAAQVSIEFQTGNEERYSQAWNRFYATSTQPAVAAQFAALRWSNPQGSSALAVFEFLSVQSATVDQPQLLILAPGTNLGTAMGAIRADPRGQPNPVLVGSRGSNASQVGNLALGGSVTANGPPYQFILTHNQEILLVPGDSLTVWSNVLNQALTVSWTWRERAIETSELN